MPTNVDINSPLAEIAKNIAELYYLKPYLHIRIPAVNNLPPYPPFEMQKLLDHKDIAIDTTGLPRYNYGYQHSCRLAALLPQLFEFYKAYAYLLPAHIQKKITSLDDPLAMKKLQIVALMRSSGRIEDSRSGAFFSKQSKKQCEAYLVKLGVNHTESNSLAELLVSMESKDPKEREKFSLEASLLSDASMMEEFRAKNSTYLYYIKLEDYALHHLIKGTTIDSSYSKVMSHYIKICEQHALVIREHQGRMYHYLKKAEVYKPMELDPETKKYSSGKDIPVDGWTIKHDRHPQEVLNEIWSTPSIVEEYAKLTQEDKNKLYEKYTEEEKRIILNAQTKLEQNPKCFEICQEDVTRAFQSALKIPMTQEALSSLANEGNINPSSKPQESLMQKIIIPSDNNPKVEELTKVFNASELTVAVPVPVIVPKVQEPSTNPVEKVKSNISDKAPEAAEDLEIPAGDAVIEEDRKTPEAELTVRPQETATLEIPSELTKGAEVNVRSAQEEDEKPKGKIAATTNSNPESCAPKKSPTDTVTPGNSSYSLFNSGAKAQQGASRKKKKKKNTRTESLGMANNK